MRSYMVRQQVAPFSSRRHDCSRRRPHDERAAASIKSETIVANDHRNRTMISRRYSASQATSFRREEYEEEEDNNTTIFNKSSASSRSNFTISSTVSSPGYNFKEEIDPSTYSFTTALRGLQGSALNSKWNEAEKYICNPLSGEVPAECLSANTRLTGRGGRSFRSSDGLTNGRRVTMSAPLYYPPKPHNPLEHPHQGDRLLLGIISDKNPSVEKGISESKRKSSSTSAPTILATTCDHHIGSKASSPLLSIQGSPIVMRSTLSPPSTPTPKVQFEEEKREEEEIKGESKTEAEAAEVTGKNELGEKGEQEAAAETEELGRRRPAGGCLSWRRFMWTRKRERDKEKLRGPTKNKNSHYCSRSIFLCPIHQW